MLNAKNIVDIKDVDMMKQIIMALEFLKSDEI